MVLSSLRERLALKANFWTPIGGPLLILGTVAAIELLSRTSFKIPNPPAILLLIVVFSAFVGGLRSGLVSAVIAWMYFAYFFSISGQPFHYTEENLRRVTVWAVTTPCMAIMVGILKSRAERTFEISKGNALLTAQIAERKRTEESLRESEARKTAILDGALDAIITMDHRGNVLEFNPAAEHIFGYRRADAIGREMAALIIPPTMREQHRAGLERYLSTGEGPVLGRRLELTGMRADGSEFPVELSIICIPSVAPVFTGFIRDISERKQAEQTLRESEEKFSKAFDASPDAVVISRQQDGLIVDANQAAEKLFGYARAELIGKTSLALGIFADPADRERVVGLLRQQGFLRDFELQIQPRAGELRNVLISSHQIEFAGTPHILTIIRDVTHLKRAEEDRLAKDAAEAASHAKSEFLSRMSHELRTPLNAILGFAQLLEMDVTGSDQRESVEQILKAGRHLLQLINEVLDIARIEAGRLTISLEPVPVADLITESLDLVRPLAAQRGLRIDEHPPAQHDLHALADRQRLKQVMLNLLSNAVKFTPEGGRVTVSCEIRPGDHVRMSIADTGPGIAAPDLARLFSPFQRLGAAQTEVEGTGLGLALTKGLVEAMGGTIGAVSEVGRGSTFWFELPIAAPPTQRVPEEAELPGAVLATVRPKRTVIYIEDNISNLKLIERVMARRPEIRLITAMQGSLGLDLVREHHPDLILLDMHLPDINGDQVLRQLQQDPATAAIPIVMLTATAQASQMERLLRAGARAYLTKPVDVQALFKLLDELFTIGGASHA